MKSLMILGATGAVGQALLALALEHPLIKHVIAPTRKALPTHPKLLNPIVDFEHLPNEASWWQCDAIICALGTTIKQAGSKEAFEKIDHDYVIHAARLAKDAGTPCFIYNSSMGANEASRSFYLHIKGKIEHHLNELGFDATYHFRPSLLIAPNREEFRLGERLGVWLMSVFAFVIPKNYRAIHVSCVAKAMLQHALSPQKGRYIIESSHIKGS